MRHLNQDTITQAVLARLAHTPDARLKELMTSLVQHLHAFARETRLTEAEWQRGVDLLTATGQHTQFALLSDVLGMSTLTVAMNNDRPTGCTEAAVLPCLPGPTRRPEGLRCRVQGRVCSLDGRAIADARVCAWPGRDAPSAVALSGPDGEFAVYTVVAPAQVLPTDGPVGQLLAATDGPAWRPAHLSLTVQAAAYETLNTQLFAQGDAHLEDDVAFAVRPSLVVPWQAQADGSFSLNYDFVLHKALA